MRDKYNIFVLFKIFKKKQKKFLDDNNAYNYLVSSDLFFFGCLLQFYSTSIEIRTLYCHFLS